MPQLLYLRTYLLRFLQTIGRYCDAYLSTPLPRGPAFKRTVKSTVGESPGEFELLFYTPPGYEKLGKDERLPLLVNFHGGGYTIGHAADDSRFITAIQSRAPCLAVSVNYRLAPEHPFPTGISDCVSSLLYLWSSSTSQELKIDPSRTVLSGFSAGGQFCFTSSYMLFQELGKMNEEGVVREEIMGKIVGLCTFYAPADWTQTREDRKRSNPKARALSRLPEMVFGMFEQAYFRDGSSSEIRKRDLDKTSPLLSPGLASSELIKNALPQNICMINCEFDSLLVESEVFKERLSKEGKAVEGYVVPGVPHGWDKYPSWFWPFGARSEKRDEAYKFAAETMKGFWT